MKIVIFFPFLFLNVLATNAQTFKDSLSKKDDTTGTIDYSRYEKHIFRESNNDSLPCRILYPLVFDKNKRYPLFIMVHGRGLRGTDNERQLKMGMGGLCFWNRKIEKSTKRL
jgi:predicted peptidase